MIKGNLFYASVRCPRCGKSTDMRASDLEDYAYQCLECDEDFYSIECPRTTSDYQNKEGNIVPLYEVTLHGQSKEWYTKHKGVLSKLCTRHGIDYFGCDDNEKLPTDKVHIDFGWEKAPSSEQVQTFTDDVLKLLGFFKLARKDG